MAPATQHETPPLHSAARAPLFPTDGAAVALNGSRKPSYGTLQGCLPKAMDKRAAPPLPPKSNADVTPMKPRHPAPTIAASSSFFGLPHSLSSVNLRSHLGLNAPPPGEIDWVSIAVVYWITLVSEASRGLMLSSTWPYLSSLGGTKAMLGVFVGSFSMGRMATTIPLGYMSDNFSTSTVLMLASSIQILGHAIYAISPSVGVLIASRVIVGFGSSTMSVCRAHLTRAVPSSQRTYHFAYLSALQFIGFAVLPGVGGLLAMLPELHVLPFFTLNGFTYPALVLIVCNMLCILVIYSFYFNPPEAAPRRRASPQNGSSSSNDDVEGPDVFALVVCLLINITFRGIVAELETVCTPFLMEHFDVSYAKASFYISFIGFFGLAVYLGFKPIAKTFSDRSLVVFGLVAVVVGCLPISSTWLSEHMSVGVYVACLGINWSLAYPVGQTAVLGLFSKVLGGLPAGGFLGIFSASGSFARIAFAMASGAIWGQFGREAVFASLIANSTLTLVLVAFTYRRLVPPADHI